MNLFPAAAGAAPDKLQQAQAHPLCELASLPEARPLCGLPLLPHPRERLGHCMGSLAKNPPVNMS
jgi:hypothetical protein